MDLKTEPNSGICVGGTNDGAYIRSYGSMLRIPKKDFLGDLDLGKLYEHVFDISEPSSSDQMELYRIAFFTSDDAIHFYWRSVDMTQNDAIQHLLERHGRLADLES